MGYGDDLLITSYASHLKKKLTSQQFKTWVRPLSFQENENDFEILAPNQFIQQWVVDRLMSAC